jgi:hypothetical protein
MVHVGKVKRIPMPFTYLKKSMLDGKHYILRKWKYKSFFSDHIEATAGVCPAALL